MLESEGAGAESDSSASEGVALSVGCSSRFTPYQTKSNSLDEIEMVRGNLLTTEAQLSRATRLAFSRSSPSQLVAMHSVLPTTKASSLQRQATSPAHSPSMAATRHGKAQSNKPSGK